MTDAEFLRTFIADARDPERWPDIHDVCGLVKGVPEWSPAVREAPPIVRAISILGTFRGQYRRNGIDGFVWNYREEVPSVSEAFAVIGAPHTAELLAEILIDLIDRDDERDASDLATRDAVAAFLALRSERGGPAFGPWLEFDPLDEVEDAILRYLDEHAEAVVEGRFPA